MKILKTQVLSGPNLWSNYRKKLIQVKIDLEEMEDLPTDKLRGFTEKIKKLLPGLVEHSCSEGVRGGFFRRLERGTWLGHVMEHVALELQTIAGMETGYGRTRETRDKGVYNMVFAYEIKEAGLFAAEASFRIIDALSKNLPYDVSDDIAQLRKIKSQYGLGPSTKSIVAEAEKRGIPWKRLGSDSRIQLGYGKNQVRFQATITGRTSAAAVDIAGDKDDTKQLLSAAHIPVPEGNTCSSETGLLEIIDEIGFPVVVKPRDANQGKGASVNINSKADAKLAFALAQAYGKHVVVEKFIPGSDYRLLVVGGKFTAASKRLPAHVAGNGFSTISELIELTNNDPRRGDGHECELTKIKVDDDTALQLGRYGYSTESILPEGETVYLKSTANLSTGGTAIDVTDEVCAENRFIAERTAAIVGLDICGIDIMATTICRPLGETGGAVIEVNAAPGFRMHLSPSHGRPRNVAAAVVDMLYPPGTESTIPVFAVTGTNGKTTTTRLLAHMAKKAGHNVGYTTTDGIYVGDYKICDGDTTGPQSAATILCDPTVDFAVLETARGGLLRSGLYFDNCDVGVITNIREDHLGLNDIHDLRDLAKVKAVVPRSVKDSGWAVLNGDDEYCARIARELSCNVAYFSVNPDSEMLQKHVQNGGCAAFIENREIVIYKNNERTLIANVANVPLTENGNVGFMVENVLAACAAAFTGGLKLEDIRAALQTFIPGYDLTPGRMNFFDLGDFKVLVDYAHNPHGLLALKSYLDRMPQRKIGIVSGIGDRRDQDIVEVGEIAAGMFDRIVVRQEHGLRGRTEKEINELITRGIFKASPSLTVDFVSNETDAVRHAMSIAEKGDLVVALSDEHPKVVAVILEEINRNKSVAIMETDHLKPIAS